MPIFREDYLKSDEQIAAQKRLERGGGGEGFKNALILAGTVAGFVIARKKIALTRTFSEELKALGRAGKTYQKYMVNRVTEKARMWPKRWYSTWRRWGEEIAKPLPGAIEQRNIAMWTMKRFGKMAAVPALPEAAEVTLGKWTHLNTMWRGPAAAYIAPGAVAATGKGIIGKRGGIAVGRNLYEFGQTGRVLRTTGPIEIGLTGFEGRLEALRLGMFEKKSYRTLRSFTENVRLPSRTMMEKETKRAVLERYGAEQLGLVGDAADLAKLEEAFNKLRNARPELKNILTPTQLFKRESGAIKSSTNDAIRVLLERELKKPAANAAYKVYRAQISLGIGEPFARYGAGELIPTNIQRIERMIRKSSEFGIRHPFTDRLMPIAPRRYAESGLSIAGMRGKTPAGFFPRPYKGAAKRTAFHLLEGTFFGVPEEMFGIGVSARGTKFTRWMTKMIGAERNSYTGYFMNRYLGGIGRIMGTGFGAYYGFKLINYMARQATGGWGVTDVAGKMYTSAREFQQNMLDQLGIVEGARKLENAFPGTIKSPFAHAARVTAPLWMAWMGKKYGGAKWGRIGLAMGIATALITWGDITQSPEELHRIYTGEQDIPIRKGRYWPFGRTPMFGGKPMYWRPHWYPLMRSKYKYQGQLWESETEELAQGSLFAPILAPILQGRLWDPYYWEKKHYYDRPYPITGELFEPTMPFAPLLNLTLGELIKPQRMMHPEYFGVPQEEAPPRELIPGAGAMLGMDGYAGEGFLPEVSPTDPQWRLTQQMYTIAEQMGLRGFMLNTLVEQLTGRPDFLVEGPILQSARRATGYERAYWDMNIGDPLGYTEFFRRLLPHRRRAIEEYNPIENLMPEWMPGSEYYINFRTGDPYTKIEMGEARLPGPGYEALHRLHSDIPGVYDAVDRFMILSDVAPYSDEYKHYRVLAKQMVRGDREWDEEIKQHIRQRAATQNEYNFLELEPPEDVTGVARPISRAYRHFIGMGTELAGLIEFAPLAPVSKFFPYKTAIGTYKDYRIYGDDFTSWGHPIRDFIAPWMNKVRGVSADLFGSEYIPGGEQKRREYEDYFDRLKYVKNLHLANTAIEQGNEAMGKKFRSIAKQTMTGVNVYGGWANIYRSMPKRERSFFDAFVNARREDREEILDMVPEPMQRLYKAQWNIVDKKADLPTMFDVGRTTSRDMVEYYKDYNLPPAEWTGWHPDVELEDVKLNVVKQEAMNIHKFNLWESRERAMARRPYVPTIEDIREPSVDLSALQNALYGQLETEGFQNSRINITRTPSLRSRIKMKFKIKRNRRNEYDRSMRELRYA